MNNTKQSKVMETNITQQLRKTKIIDKRTKERIVIFLNHALTESRENEELIEIINFAYSHDLPDKERLVEKAKRNLIINKVNNIKVQVCSGRLIINDKSYLQLNEEEKVVFREYLKTIV